MQIIKADNPEGGEPLLKVIELITVGIVYILTITLWYSNLHHTYRKQFLIHNYTIKEQKHSASSTQAECQSKSHFQIGLATDQS